MSRVIARSNSHARHFSRSVVEAHRHHADAPFFGCPLCIRPAPFRGVPLRWSSPRLG